LGRVEHLDAWISFTIGTIESKIMGESMPLHGGNEASVVSWSPFNGAIDHQFFPRFKNPAFITKRWKEPLEPLKAFLRLVNREAQAIFRDWTSSDSPELVEDLRYNSKFVPPLVECVKCSRCDGEKWMTWLG
jgi:hypothetical protein